MAEGRWSVLSLATATAAVTCIFAVIAVAAVAAVVLPSGCSRQAYTQMRMITIIRQQATPHNTVWGQTTACCCSGSAAKGLKFSTGRCPVISGPQSCWPARQRTTAHVMTRRVAFQQPAPCQINRRPCTALPCAPLPPLPLLNINCSADSPSRRASRPRPATSRRYLHFSP